MNIPWHQSKETDLGLPISSILASQSHVDGATIAAGSPYGCGVQPDEVGAEAGRLRHGEKWMTCLGGPHQIRSVVIHWEYSIFTLW